MNLKKCLKTSRAWSFLEYTIIFAAITMAVAGTLKSIMSNKGEINKIFMHKTNESIQQIKK
jgi:hypothetical protein